MQLKRYVIYVPAVFMICLFAFVEFLSAEEKEKSKPAIEFLGQVYMNWHAGMTKGNDLYPGNKTNTFEIERAALSWLSKFDEIFSARITLDVVNDSVIEGATQNTDTNKTNQGGSVTSRYRPYLKYAFLQAKKSFGQFDFGARAGMIDTPVIGLIDVMGDQRWIHRNMIDDSKNILPDTSGLDNTADAGISIGMDFQKRLNLTLALTNGEGLKNTNESLFNNSSDSSKNTAHGKAIYARLNASPMEHLSVFGFSRFEGTSSDQLDNYRGYYGGGIAWIDGVFKSGAYYAIPFLAFNGESARYTSGDAKGEKKKMYFLEYWLTINAKEYTNIPSLLLARFGLGNDFDQKNLRTTYVGAGIGYEYSKYIRVAGWYDQYNSKANDNAGKPNPLKVFSVKAEILL